MPLFFRRRRIIRKQQPERRIISRRGFLAGAAASAMIIGCRSVFLTAEQMHDLVRAKELRAKPPIITALRKGKSVKMAIENTSRVNIEETGLQKERRGEVRETSLRRYPGSISQLDLGPKVRSIIHTHIYTPRLQPELCREKTIPSATDLLDMLDSFTVFKPKTKLKYSHLAIIDPDGELIGYFSFMVGKKLKKVMKFSLSNIFTKDYGKLVAIKEKLRMMQNNDSELMHEIAKKGILRIYNECINGLRELGLKMRATPMKGYAYKDGYFQPETKR